MTAFRPTDHSRVIRAPCLLLVASIAIASACAGDDGEMRGGQRPQAGMRLEAPHMQEALVAELDRNGVKFQIGSDGYIYYDPVVRDKVSTAVADVIKRATPECFVIAESVVAADEIAANLRTAGIAAIVGPGVAPNSWYVLWDSSRCDEGNAALRQTALMQLQELIKEDEFGKDGRN